LGVGRGDLGSIGRVGSLTLAPGYFLDIFLIKSPRRRLFRNEWDIEKPVVQDSFEVQQNITL